jgi:murein DD-endopeptidase MepM/ murein hydrolase activator NlpD
MCCFTELVFAKSDSELKDELNNNQNSTKTIQENLSDTQEQKKAIQAEVELLDQELAVVEADMDVINESLAQTEQKLTNTTLQLNDVETLLNIQTEAFKNRARFMYTNGKLGYLNLLFSAKNFTDFVSRIEYVNRLVIYDNSLVSGIKRMQNAVAVTLGEIEKQKLEIEVLVTQKAGKQRSLEETLSQKTEVVRKLDADEQEYLRQINGLDESSKEIERILKQRELDRAAAAAAANKVSSVPYTGGTVAWPIPGHSRITSPFGNRTNPINRRGEFHTGIDVGAPTGTQILAADDGVVVTSGVMNGYGNCVLIDHGNGLATFYAHGSKLVASRGQVVEKGQLIMKCGSTGYSTGPHLHFEVRVNGTAKNPIDYLKG